MVKSKLIAFQLLCLTMLFSLLPCTSANPGLFQASDPTKAARFLRGGLKGQKRTAYRNQPHSQGHFYDDDDFARRGDYYDDGPALNTNARKESRHKKGKKHHKANYGDDAYYDMDDLQGTFGLTFDDDDCEMVSLDDTFTLPSATFFLAPDTTTAVQGTPSLPGTVFLWDNELVGSPAVNNSTTVSGTCTRTSSTLGGICNFVFVDAGEDISVTVAGFLSNPTGGALAITGGTGDLLANIGQMQLSPVYQDGSNATTGSDVFLDAVEYDVAMNLGIIVCPDAALSL